MSEQELAKVLREELAWNPHGDDEANMRCVCDECIAALHQLGVRIVDPKDMRARFHDLAEAAYWLPISPEHLETAPVKWYRQMLHRLHVVIAAVSGVAPSPHA